MSKKRKVNHHHQHTRTREEQASKGGGGGYHSFSSELTSELKDAFQEAGIISDRAKLRASEGWESIRGEPLQPGVIRGWADYVQRENIRRPTHQLGAGVIVAALAEGPRRAETRKTTAPPLSQSRNWSRNPILILSLCPGEIRRR